MASRTPETDAAIADGKKSPFGNMKEFTDEQLNELSGVSIPRGAARIVKVSRRLEVQRDEAIAQRDEAVALLRDLVSPDARSGDYDSARAFLAKHDGKGAA